MNANVVLIFVAALIASVVAVAYVFFTVSQQFKTTSYLTKLLGEQYGFVRTEYEINYEIGRDGSARSSYREVLVATNAELVGIEHYTSITTEPRHIRENFRIETPKTAKDPAIEVVQKPMVVTPSRLLYQLLFYPPVLQGRKIEFTHDIYGPPGMFTESSEELKNRNLPYDYVSMKIAYPTNRLVMTVVFPAEWYIERLAYDVWLGDARLRLQKEFQRLEKDPRTMTIERRDKNLVARFVVDYPILDLKYAITWNPLQRTQN